MITTQNSLSNTDSLPVTVNNGRIEFAAVTLSSPNLDGNIPQQETFVAVRSLKPGWYAKVDGDTFALIIDIVENPLAVDEYNLRILQDSSVRRIVVKGSDEVIARYEDWDNRTIGTTGWMLTASGNALLSNVAVRGTIEATDGKFDGTLYAGNARLGKILFYEGTGQETEVYGIALTSNDYSNYWLDDGSFNLGGGDGITYQPGSGEIVLGTDVKILGNIDAVTGSIGGWTIADNQFYSNDLHLMSDDTNGIAIIYSGLGQHGNVNTGFYVDGQGKFSLKDKLRFEPDMSGNGLADLQVIGSISGQIKNYDVVESNQGARNMVSIVDVSGPGQPDAARITYSGAALSLISGDTVVIEGSTASDGAYRVISYDAIGLTVDVEPSPALMNDGIGTVRIRELTMGLHASDGIAPAGLGIKLDSSNYWFVNNQFRVGSLSSGISWDGAVFQLGGNAAGYNVQLETTALHASIGILSDDIVSADPDNKFANVKAPFYTDTDGRLSIGSTLRFETDQVPGEEDPNGILTINGNITADGVTILQNSSTGLAEFTDNGSIVSTGISAQSVIASGQDVTNGALHLTGSNSQMRLSNGARLRFQNWTGMTKYDTDTIVIRPSNTDVVNIDLNASAPANLFQIGDVAIFYAFQEVQGIDINGKYTVTAVNGARSFSLQSTPQLASLSDITVSIFNVPSDTMGTIAKDSFAVDPTNVGKALYLDNTGSVVFSETDNLFGPDGPLQYVETDPPVQTRRYPFSLREEVLLPEEGVNGPSELTQTVIQFDIPYPGTITIDFSAVLYSIQPATGYAYVATNNSAGGDLQFAGGWPISYQSNVGGEMQHISGKTIYTARQANETVSFYLLGATHADIGTSLDSGLIRMVDLRGIITYDPFGVVYQELELT